MTNEYNESYTQNSEEKVSLLCDKEHVHEYNTDGFCILCWVHKIQQYGDVDEQTQKDVIGWFMLNTKTLQIVLDTYITKDRFENFKYVPRNKELPNYVNVTKQHFPMKEYNKWLLTVGIEFHLNVPKVRGTKTKVIMLRFLEIVEQIRKDVNISSFELKQINFYENNRFEVEFSRHINLPLKVGNELFKSEDEE